MHLFPVIVLRAKSQIRLVQVARFSFLFPSLSFSLSCLSFLLFLSPVVFHTALLTDSFYNNSAQATENRILVRSTHSLSIFLSFILSLQAEQRRRAIALESRRPDKRAVAMVTSRASWLAFVVTWFNFLSGQLPYLSNILSNHNYYNILFKVKCVIISFYMQRQQVRHFLVGFQLNTSSDNSKIHITVMWQWLAFFETVSNKAKWGWLVFSGYNTEKKKI